MSLNNRNLFSALLICVVLFIAVLPVDGEVSPLTIDQNGNSSVSIVCRVPDIGLSQVQIDEKTFQKIDILTDGLIGSPGGPAIPSWSSWVEIPDGMSPQLQITSSNEEIIRDCDLAPFPTTNDNPNITEITAVSQVAYSSNETIPSQSATLSDIVTIGNKRYAIVDVTPYKYNPSLRELTIIKDLQVDITFQNSEDDDRNDNHRQVDAPVWAEVERAIGNAPPGRDDGDSRVNILGHYVIVTADREDIIEAVQPLVEWKQRKGYKVTVANLADIGNSPAALKGWLTDAYNEWDIPPTFVLLTGDATGDARIPFFSDGAAETTSWASSDNQFVCWDGLDDGPEMWIPEGFVGRIPARDARDLENLVEKIIGYEADPYTEEPWVEGAVLIANGVRSCSHTNVAIREIMEANGYDRDDIHEAYADWHAGQRPNRGPINDRIDDGVGFVNFRGYNDWGGYYANQGEITSRHNGWKMPIVTGMVCGTNDFPGRFTGGGPCIGEAFLRTNNNPGGAVATYGPTDLHTHTWFNNTMDAEFYNVLFNKGVHTLGVAVLASKLAVLRAYPLDRRLGNGTTTGYYFYSYTLLGDPGLQVWTKDPKPMTVDFSEELPIGATSIEVAVFDADDVAIKGAYVHVFRSNDNSESRFGAYTDEEGMVQLIVAPLEEGEYQLTVTGANLVPVLESIQVGSVSQFTSVNGLSVDDNMNDDSDGNGDGEVNPSETIELSISLLNSGENECEMSLATLSCNSAWVEITRSQVGYPSIRPDEDSEGASPFLFHCLPGTPDSEILEFMVSVHSGDGDWSGAFDLPVVGYEFDLVEFELSDELFPGTEQELIVTIQNVGSFDSDQLTVSLTCDDVNVQIRRAESPFGELESGESSNNAERPFVVYANPNAYKGSECQFNLTIHDEIGRVDKVSFDVLLGEPSVDSPQGPDKYGYMAFDTRDEDSGMAPEYDWVAGRDQLNSLRDVYEPPPAYNSDQGSKVYVDLPFNFTYYGRRYSEITVGSNGWLCFGRTDQISWNNQELGSALGPPAMLCPLWDDLWNGSAYTYYDEENARFIIEWRNYTSNVGGGATFAVQLFDPTVLSTATGDGEIHFVYNSLPNLRRDYAQEQATIGISSPDREDGIQITHARQWDPRTADIGEHMTIRFTTGEFTEVGTLEGHVVDVADNTPIEGVRVMIEDTGFFGNSDQEGVFLIERVPEGTYTVTTYFQHFNDASSADVDVITDEATEVNFSLTHPTFNIDIEQFDVGVEPDTTAEESFAIWNEGNGDLDYRLKLDPDVDRDEQWDVQFDFDVSAQTPTNDRYIRGITYNGEKFFTTGRVARSDYPHKIYVLNNDGEMIGDIDQYTVDSSATQGYHELAWNGENLLAAENGNILEITLEGELVGVVVETEEREIQNICWSPERETIFAMPRRVSDLIEYDTDGNVVESYARVGLPDRSMVYGLSWFPADVDGYNLYIFTDPLENNPFGTRLELYKINLETGDILFVNHFYAEDSDKAHGCTITKKWNPLTWTFVGLVNNPNGDRIIGWELAPNFTWITYDPSVGSVPAGDNQQFTVNFLPEDLPDGDYNVSMDVFHNAVGDQYRIPVHLNIGPQAVFGDNTEIPTQFMFHSAYPNPFNPSTRLRFDLPADAVVVLTVWDVSGRVVEQTDMGDLSAGQHQLQFNADDLAGGIYFAQLTAGQYSATQKLLLLR